MAYFKITDIFTIGGITGIKATSWQVATDKEFKNIIYESLKDTKNLTEIRVGLQKEDGSWYDEDDELYVRVKFHFESCETEWYLIPINRSKRLNIWINAEDSSNNCRKELVGKLEYDKDGKIMTDIEDEERINYLIKKRRDEKYRTDYGNLVKEK